MCQLVLNGKTPGSSCDIAFAGRMLLRNCLAWGGLAIKPCSLQPQALRRSSKDNIELMTQKEVLNLKPAPRLEQIDDKCSKQIDYRKHRVG